MCNFYPADPKRASRVFAIYSEKGQQVFGNLA